MKSNLECETDRHTYPMPDILLVVGALNPVAHHEERLDDVDLVTFVTEIIE